ncbi:MAG: hypothetical protein LC797_16285 [Chloroflexi bacterium]|nr:hypothetical protein [Chloroflexota bacterium]
MRLDRSKRVECLIEQVAHDARLWLIAGRTNVADREVVVHAHMALDETRDVPTLGRAVITLEDEDVATRRSAAVALAAALMVRVGER